MKTPVEWNQTELSVSACFTSVSKLSDLSLTLTKGQRPLCLYVLETRVMEKKNVLIGGIAVMWRCVTDLLSVIHTVCVTGSSPGTTARRLLSVTDSCRWDLGAILGNLCSSLGGPDPPTPTPPPRAVPLVLRRFHIMSRPDGPDWTQETSDCVETRTEPDDETKRRRFHLFLAVGLQVPIPPLTLFTKLSLTFAVMTLNNRNTWGCRQSAAHHFTVSVVITEGLHRGDAHRVFFFVCFFF